MEFLLIYIVFSKIINLIAWIFLLKLEWNVNVGRGRKDLKNEVSFFYWCFILTATLSYLVYSVFNQGCK